MAAIAGCREVTGLDYDEHHLKRSPTLRFSVGTDSEALENARRLIAAVDSAVAARADGPDVEELEASFVYVSAYDGSANFHDIFHFRGYMARHDHAIDITSAHLARWLRFAAGRVTGSFVLSVPTVPAPAEKEVMEDDEELVIFGDEDNEDGGVLRRRRRRGMSGVVKQADAAAVREIRELYVELPASSRTEKVSLTLGDAEIMVPVARAGAFSALTDLFLSHCTMETGDLGRMLSSSCCPRLRRLRLEQVSGLHALRLEAAGTLEDVLLDRVKDMSVLHLDAPGLRSLHLVKYITELSDVSVSAPALDTLGCEYDVPPDRTELDGAASVRRLEKLYLWSHGFPPEGQQEYSNGGAAWLLERCVAAESLEARITAPALAIELNGGTAELIGLLPRLPAVTDLSIDAWVTESLGPCHRLGHSVARLIARCDNLRRLAVEFTNQYYELCEAPNCFCGTPEPEMEVMEQLVEAKIVAFRPLEDQVSLVRGLMAKAPALERMTVQFQWSDEDDGELPLPRDRGHWARSAAGPYDEPAYEWTPADP